MNVSREVDREGEPVHSFESYSVAHEAKMSRISRTKIPGTFGPSSMHTHVFNSPQFAVSRLDQVKRMERKSNSGFGFCCILRLKCPDMSLDLNRGYSSVHTGFMSKKRSAALGEVSE